ncbi:MAG TPA: hypothetical protein ENN21_09675 [Spirochaetes bacterium]|nr:hypothetical protein [Spirochaetota bacterium]
MAAFNGETGVTVYRPSLPSRLIYAVPALTALALSVSVWFWDYRDFQKSFDYLIIAYLIIAPFVGFIGFRAYAVIRHARYRVTPGAVTHIPTGAVLEWARIRAARRFHPPRSFHSFVELSDGSRTLCFIASVREGGRLLGKTLADTAEEMTPGVEWSHGLFREKKPVPDGSVTAAGMAGIVIPFLIVLTAMWVINARRVKDYEKRYGKFVPGESVETTGAPKRPPGEPETGH